ncbi:hypothetical protein SCLCIDRAFT_31639 [Scleroderma citrinum Foug A]|uniref:Uncharacterized protein n=1 Tax=Scleroderma citrinum Foug A TaxID=1036808 RepID=A0A0C2YVV4_9AGAM|nr:hypothetical protein SCLCIDRAFT_31639 [Scleroderma citrinum Foug A]
MSQHAINKQDLKHAYILLCSWGCKFELIYYQLRQDRLHFIHPCIHQVLHLVTETMHKGPPICYAQWTMEHTIGNLRQEIQQASKLYENLAEEGVWRSRVNALLIIMPKLNDGIKGSPTGSIDLGEGYARDSPSPLQMMGASSSSKRAGCPISVARKPQITLSATHIKKREVYLWWTGTIWRSSILRKARYDRDADEAWKFEDVALICLYSLPDESLLKMSSHTLVSSSFSGEFVVIHIKSIRSVVGMISHHLKCPSGITEDCFFLMEKLGLDISQLGIPYSVYQEEEDHDAEVE